MNRFVKFLSLAFAIPIALQLVSAWHMGTRTSYQEQSKKNLVAVLDFDATAVGTDVLGDKVDVGKEIAGLLAQRLAEERTYLVVDSKTMSADLAEHNFSKSDQYDREFAVKLGKRLGADGVILGNVTLFGKDSHARPVPQDEVLRRKIKARVAADARIVDAATGEIVAAESGRGESKREGISLTSGGNTWHDFRSGNFGFDSKEFQETILGEAVNDMVLQLSAVLAADASRLTVKTASH
jgi:curli biogenesis system outer membrane secretion channel CsgG